MGWFILSHIFPTILSLIQVSRLSDKDKDLEVIILRHQLSVINRLHTKLMKPNRAQKMTLAVLTKKLRQSKNRTTHQQRSINRLIQPETVLRWQRKLVRRIWTYQQKIKGGRPRIHQEKENLIVRLAKENLRWGYGKIEGELLKLGFKVSISTGQLSAANSDSSNRDPAFYTIRPVLTGEHLKTEKTAA